MRLEIHSAANFLVQLLRLHPNSLNEEQMDNFKESLTDLLRRRYRDHWFPDLPTRGSGYRCIRINGKMDPVITQAGEACGLAGSYMHSLFPSELTMWIDPREVSYRIGENGSICVLYEEKIDEYSPRDRAMANKENSCKESLRNAEIFLDPRGAVVFEQMPPYVSS